MRTTRRTLRLAAAVGALLLLGAVGCANGSNTEEDFDGWHADHPVPGARLVDRSATDSIFGHGEFSATYDLTAKPSERAIRAAMKGACGFNGETKAATSYVLTVATVTMEVACRPENQVKVARFWTAVKDLPVTSVRFNQGRADAVAGSVAEAVDAGVLDALVRAGTADGLIDEGSYGISGSGPSVSVSTGSYDGIRRELALVHSLLRVATPSALNTVTAIEGQVIASSDASVAQARAWEDRANGSGERLLVVASAKTGFSKIPTPAGRDLVDDLAARPSVQTVVVRTDGWSVTAADLDTMGTVLTTVSGAADRAAGVSLGPLDVDRARETGTECEVAAALPDVDQARTLLRVCSVPDGSTHPVDRRPVVSGPDTALPALLAVVHDLSRGTRVLVSRDVAPYESVEVRVDDPLRTSDATAPAYEKKVAAAWQRLGPLP